MIKVIVIIVKLTSSTIIYANPKVVGFEKYTLVNIKLNDIPYFLKYKCDHSNLRDSLKRNYVNNLS